MFVTTKTHSIISHVQDFCLHECFTGNEFYYIRSILFPELFNDRYGHRSHKVFGGCYSCGNKFCLGNLIFRYITGNAICAIQTCVYISHFTSPLCAKIKVVVFGELIHQRRSYYFVSPSKILVYHLYKRLKWNIEILQKFFSTHLSKIT